MLRVDLGTTYTEELVIGVKMNRSKMFRSSLSQNQTVRDRDIVPMSQIPV